MPTASLPALLGLSASLQLWITPIWLLSLGTTAGLAILLLIWFVISLFSRQSAATIWLAVREGPLWPVSIIGGALALVSVLGGFAALNVEELLDSLARIPTYGTRVVSATLEPGEELVEIPVTLRGDELAYLRAESNTDLELRTRLPVTSEESLEDSEEALSEEILAEQASERLVLLEVRAEEPLEVIRDEELARRFEGQNVPALYATNLGEDSAKLTLTITTQAVFPEVSMVYIAAISTMGIYLLYMLQRFLLPKISAIALATCKSEMSQPLFTILLLLGASALLVLPIVPYHTFGEDIKMLKDSSLTLIMILSIVMAVWAASESVAEELEGKTALTVLSKPVSRRSFIIGKFFGICWTVAVMFIVLGLLCLLVIAFKPIYDTREMSYKPDYAELNTVGEQGIRWQICYTEMVQTVPGLVLAFFEAAVMAAISVAMSTRLPMLANFLIAAAVYVIGHLTPLIVRSQVGEFEPVAFAGQFVATIFPALDHFNIYAAIAGGRFVPLSYLGFALLYCVLYCSVAMLLALVLFEDRDLA